MAMFHSFLHVYQRVTLKCIQMQVPTKHPDVFAIQRGPRQMLSVMAQVVLLPEYKYCSSVSETAGGDENR